MAASASAHVLLETVARNANAGAKSSGAGNGQANGAHDGGQWQGLLATVANAGHANRDDKRLVARTGLGQYPCALDEGARLRLRLLLCSALMNRRVRTRMPGGVGRAG